MRAIVRQVAGRPRAWLPALPSAAPLIRGCLRSHPESGLAETTAASRLDQEGNHRERELEGRNPLGVSSDSGSDDGDGSHGTSQYVSEVVPCAAVTVAWPLPGHPVEAFRV